MGAIGAGGRSAARCIDVTHDDDVAAHSEHISLLERREMMETSKGATGGVLKSISLFYIYFANETV